MSYRVSVVDLDNGEGTISVAPGRLVALEGDGGTVSFHNRGMAFASGDRLPDAEEFVEGHCVFYGTPGSTARAWFRF